LAAKGIVVSILLAKKRRYFRDEERKGNGGRVLSRKVSVLCFCSACFVDALLLPARYVRTNGHCAELPIVL